MSSTKPGAGGAPKDSRDAQRPHLQMGQLLTDLRKEAGLTRNQVVASSGVHYSVLANLESGRRRATNSMITRLAPTLGVSPRRLKAARTFIEGDREPAEDLLALVLGTHRDDTDESLDSSQTFERLEQLPVPDPATGSGALLDVVNEWVRQRARVSFDPEVSPSPTRAKRQEALYQDLRSLSDSDLQRVIDFVAGINAARGQSEEGTAASRLPALWEESAETRGKWLQASKVSQKKPQPPT